MDITIIGSGNMARAIATRFVASGNHVTIVARNADKAAHLAKELSTHAKKGATIKSAVLGSPIPDPIVVFTLWYNTTKEIVQQYNNLFAGKILVDITNPLNHTYDDLATPPDSSAAEEIAKVAPKDAKVIKAFNTTFAGLLAQGHVRGQPLDVFIAGDDEKAKAAIAQLVEEGGQRAIDAGPLKRARQLEGVAFLNITLQSKLESPWMNAVKILA